MQIRQKGLVAGVLAVSDVRQQLLEFFPLKSAARLRAVDELLAVEVPTPDVFYPKLLLEEHEEAASRGGLHPLMNLLFAQVGPASPGHPSPQR
jgi:hypothetical protein